MRHHVAVIGGTGAEGSALATRWVRAGEPVLIGSRDTERAKAKAAEIARLTGDRAAVEGLGNAAAAAEASIIVLTIPFSAHAATLKLLKPAISGDAIVIDATVPLADAVGGRVTRTLGLWQGSAAQQAAELLPGVPVVAALHNLSAHLLAGDGYVDCDVLVCGDDPGARQRAVQLIEKIPGVRALHAGKLENARTAEQITALLIAINKEYRVHSAGLRLTGLPQPIPKP